MNKRYIVQKDTVVELLDHYEEFKKKMDLFVSKHPEYTYTLEIHQKPKHWEIEANIIRDEKHENYTGIKRTT